MKPLMVALYDDYGTAVRVRTELVGAGLATDRVELTSVREHGEADAEPGSAGPERYENYFRVLLEQSGEERLALDFARRVAEGASAVTVHPRFEHEIDSARRILAGARPAALQELH